MASRSIRPWYGCSSPIEQDVQNCRRDLPMAAILLALLSDEPVAGLTWLPVHGPAILRIGGAAVRDNGIAQPPLTPPGLADSIVPVSRRSTSSHARTGSRTLSLRNHNWQNPQAKEIYDCGCRATGVDPSPTSLPGSSMAPSVSATTSGTTRQVSPGPRRGRRRDRPDRCAVDTHIEIRAGRSAGRAMNECWKS